MKFYAIQINTLNEIQCFYLNTLRDGGYAFRLAILNSTIKLEMFMFKLEMVFCQSLCQFFLPAVFV